MINTKRLLKVTIAWTSIVYAVCYAGVTLFAGIRPAFMMYAVHTQMDLGRDVMTLGTFISGIIIWNIVAVLAAWLFAALWNAIKN